MKRNTLIGIIIGAVIIAGLGFWGGMAYGAQKSSQTRQNGFSGQMMGGRQGGQFGGRMGGNGGFVTGKILSKDATSITVGLPNGGSKIIFLSDSTTISKSAPGTSNDLTPDQNVVVNGKANSDGSVSATMIQVGSIPRFGGQGSTTPQGR